MRPRALRRENAPTNYINELTRLRNLLTEMKEPITDRPYTHIVLQYLTEEYRDVKLIAEKDPDFELNANGWACTTSSLPTTGRAAEEQDGEDC